MPIWRLRAALARRRASVDLVVARLDRLSATLALDASYVAVPEWVGARAPVPDDARQFCRAQQEPCHNMARGRRAGLRPEVSHELRDFDDFYDRMYVPFVRAGSTATEAVVSNRAAHATLLSPRRPRVGGRDGAAGVAGVLYRTPRDDPRSGRARHAPTAISRRARDGRGLRARALRLRARPRARLHGGRLRRLAPVTDRRPARLQGALGLRASSTNRTMFYDLCLAWDRLTPPLLAFLTRTPLIFRQSDGLAALWASVDTSEIGAARPVLQSLRRLYLLGDADDASTDARDPDHPRRPDGAPGVAAGEGAGLGGLRRSAVFDSAAPTCTHSAPAPANGSRS